MQKRRLVIDPDTKVLLKQIAVGLGVISAVALVILFIWYGTRLQQLTLVDVVVAGGETVDLTEIEQVVQAELEGSYIGLIPRRFAWLYPKDDVLARIDTVPRVHDIVVSREGGNRLSVTFNEYTPDGLWCSSAESDRCVFVSNQAYAYDEAPQLSGGSLRRFVSLGTEPEVGQVMLDSTAYGSLQKLVVLLEQNELYVSHVEFDQVGDAFLGLSGGGELKVLISASPAETVDNLQAILQSQDFAHLEPGNFQYIDLRFGEKIFIKEEETALEIETEQATSTTEMEIQDEIIEITEE